MNGNGVGATTLAYLRGEKDLVQERDRFAQARKQLQSSVHPFGLSASQNRRLERFWQVASLLQENSRMSITEISKNLKIPVATVFDTLKEVEKHFHFTILPKETDKNASGKPSSALEFGYQVSIDTSEGEVGNGLKG
jgi:hypothetical protein